MRISMEKSSGFDTFFISLNDTSEKRGMYQKSENISRFKKQVLMQTI